jgi:hypothetical protein
MKELEYSDIYLLIFIKSSCVKYVHNFDQHIIKTSFITNKGSCLLRFNINDTTIALSCSHLTYGEEKSDERKEQMESLLSTRFKKYPYLTFNNYDYFFLFGDLNIRLDLEITNPLMVELINNKYRETNGDFSELYAFDQFSKYAKENTILSDICEAKIKFSPTYKYTIDSITYDISKRTPSWCDRIFYKKSSKTIPLAYNKCLLTISNHQPIYGVYKIQTEIVNIEKKNDILNHIIREKKNNIESKNWEIVETSEIEEFIQDKNNNSINQEVCNEIKNNNNINDS